MGQTLEMREVGVLGNVGLGLAQDGVGDVENKGRVCDAAGHRDLGDIRAEDLGGCVRENDVCKRRALVRVAHEVHSVVVGRALESNPEEDGRVLLDRERVDRREKVEQTLHKPVLEEPLPHVALRGENLPDRLEPGRRPIRLDGGQRTEDLGHRVVLNAVHEPREEPRNPVDDLVEVRRRVPPLGQKRHDPPEKDKRQRRRRHIPFALLRLAQRNRKRPRLGIPPFLPVHPRRPSPILVIIRAHNTPGDHAVGVKDRKHLFQHTIRLGQPKRDKIHRDDLARNPRTLLLVLSLAPRQCNTKKSHHRVCRRQRRNHNRVLVRTHRKNITRIQQLSINEGSVHTMARGKG